ncbi:hypothetical protein HK104_000206 [Borealophlyctis nickersoniae]|nr:hypothetical protein HK104_000206 [Borealophlyctis nickersoniae]
MATPKAPVDVTVSLSLIKPCHREKEKKGGTALRAGYVLWPALKLSEEDRAFYEKYGRLPPQKNKILGQRLKGGDRKYFDSGDYALSKAGKSSPAEVGSQHPSPERIPHSIPQNIKKAEPAANTPAKESGLVHEQKVDTKAAEVSGGGDGSQ